MANAEKSILDTFNAGFEILSVLSSVYGKAAQWDYVEERKKFWTANVELSLKDIEACVDVWQTNLDEIEYGLPLGAENPFAARAARLKLRFTQLDRCVHPWVILRRLPRALSHFEALFRSYVDDLAQAYPLDQENWQIVSTSVQKRVATLRRLQYHFANETRSLML